MLGPLFLSLGGLALVGFGCLSEGELAGEGENWGVRDWLGSEVLISNERKVGVKVVDAVTAEDAVEAGETVRFILVPSPRVASRVSEAPGFTSM